MAHTAVHDATQLLGGTGGDPVAALTTPVDDVVHNITGGGIGSVSSVIDGAGGAVGGLENIMGGDMTPHNPLSSLTTPVDHILAQTASAADTPLGNVADGVQTVTHTLDSAAGQGVAGVTTPVENGLNAIVQATDAPMATVNDAVQHTVSGVLGGADPAEGILTQLDNSLTDLGGHSGALGAIAPVSGLTGADPGIAGGLSSGLDGGSGGDTAWPEAAATSASDLVHQAAGSLGGDAGAPALPDPAGNVLEGLNTVVDHAHAAAIHSALGGLLG
jgi:hypothetical protein